MSIYCQYSEKKVMKNPSAKEVKKILLALNRTVETFNKHFDNIVYKSDSKMTVSRWQLLFAVNQLKFPTISSVARALKNSRQNISVIVNGMVKDGLLVLVDNPQHKKSKILNITQLGFEKLEFYNNQRDTLCNHLSNEFEFRDLQNTRAVLQKLSGKLEK